MLSLLEFLADRTAGPVLFICTARPELANTAPGWGGGQRSFSSLALDPLTEDEAGELVGLLLRVDEMPAAVRSEILSRAEGNPFFIEEILRQLIDECCIVRTGDRWRAAEKISRVLIPDTVQAVLAARIDLLSTAEKRALQCAAVVGRVFWTGVVASLLEVDREQATALIDKLEHRDLVRSRMGTTLEGEQEYSFRHVLTRDVAFDGLSLRERTHFHRRAADWVEMTSGDRRREVVEVLAYHLSHSYQGLRDDPSISAGELEEIRLRAVHHLLLASESARLKMALETARRHAKSARLLATSPGEEARALEALGEAFLFGYEGDAAWRYLREAIDLHILAGDQTDRELASLCARAIETPVRWPGSMQSVPIEEEVHRYLQRGFEHAGNTDNPERARLLTLEAFWPHAFGRPPERSHEALVPPSESLEAGLAAVAMAGRLERADLESGALDGVGANYIPDGRYDRALEVTDRRVRLTEEIDDPWEVGDTYAMGGWVNFHLGRYRDAFAHADTGFTVTYERVPSVALHCLSWRALARYRLGQWDGVLTDLELADGILGDRREAPPHYISAMHAAAALVHEIRENSAEADRILAILQSLDQSAEPRDRDTTPLGRWAPFVAPLLARRGDIGGARRLVEETTWRRGAREGLLLESACEIAAETGAWEGVEGLIDRARAEAVRCHLDALPLVVDRLDGTRAMGRGDTGTAVTLLRRSATGFERLGARWDRARCDLALARAMGGRGEEARAALARAEAVFEELGAARECREARRLKSST